MPTLILERLQASSKRPDQLDGVTATLEDLDVCDATNRPWVPLLYQAGYLTIKDVTWETNEYKDRFPRKGACSEIRDAVTSCGEDRLADLVSRVRVKNKVAH